MLSTYNMSRIKNLQILDWFDYSFVGKVQSGTCVTVTDISLEHAEQS